MSIQPYDEWYHAGTLRPAVASLCRRTGVKVASPTAECVAALTCRPLGDATRVLPLPLVLADDEYTRVIVPGVMQRARALQSLFHDLFAGERALVGRSRLVGDGLIECATAGEGCTVEEISQLWHGRSLSEVRFVYGPDLMRDDGGSWVVLEDNIGCVGGVGDGWPILAAYLGASGASLHESVWPRDELGSAVRALVDDVGITSDEGDILGLPGEPAGGALLDDDRSVERKASALARLGVRIGGSAGHFDEAPSAVVNLGGTMSPDFRRLGGRWFGEHRVATLGAPGVGVLSSKAFLPIVDDVIRVVLGEEPLLLTAPTRPVAVSSRDVIGSLAGVVKRINGCGGSEVLFLADHDVDEVPRLRDLVASWGEGGAVWQQFVTGSVIPAAGPRSWQAFRVELRPIAYVVGAARVVVADVPVGRAMSTLGDRRGNLTRGAHYLPVLREPVP